MSDVNSFAQLDDSAIAIIGMACRFPKAKNVDEYWQKLRDGVELISFFSDQELESSGVDPAVLSDPNYVKAAAVLEDAEMFDASFFGYNPREAEIIDPQHRLFLECAWTALESAGYDGERYEGLIGVYGGAGMNTYLTSNLSSNPALIESVGEGQLRMGNRIDNLATRVSYKLNLRGPSFTVQTGCSTSLVAVHLACQSLLSGECDMALAGGVRVGGLQKIGYFYQEGGIESPDGHCRAFDARAKGIVGGNGVGVVVLKRLSEARADGDHIHAVIKGSAVNNDGSLKVGYTAPSVEGQAKVITEALAMAGVEPETITYVEAHGTGTVLGDPIEIVGLTQAFRASTEKKGFCGIGSVKTNMGHTDTAAGVAGLIKTVLALEHKLLPPSLHFERPNPTIDFENSPFYVNAQLTEWKTEGTLRRAGVSSFGVGGTNAHAVLEEAPLWERSGESRPAHLLMLSAKTSSALETMTSNLAEYLKQHLTLRLADVAYTLGVGRRAFSVRRTVVCRDLEDAVSALETLDPRRVFTAGQVSNERPVAFMFSGQGAQYVNMALELYQVEASFRDQIDHCSKLLEPHLGLDLRQILFPSEEKAAEATERLKQTWITQPALFVIEYALAKLWLEWGLHPQAMIGHSIGEYVAACLAGVFSLEDALALVAARGRLMQQLPGGAMLSVPLAEKDVQSLLGENLSLAAVNGPSLSVVSGPEDAIDALEQRLTEQEVNCRRLHTSHAFHSKVMDSILEPFAEQVRKLDLKSPKIPYISNVTGTWIKATEATDPSYWARHLRQTVRFAEGLHELLKESERVLLEVGPGQTLSTLARQHPEKTAGHVVLSSLRHVHDQYSDVTFLLNTLGRLWLSSVEVDWSRFYLAERAVRVPLPTYPFERERYWVEPQKQTGDVSRHRMDLYKKPNIADWFYVPSWKRAAPLQLLKRAEMAERKSRWMVFTDGCGIGSQMVDRLEQAGQDVITVMAAEQFGKVDERVYQINPRERDDYDALLQDLHAGNKDPTTIVHLWSVTPNDGKRSEVEFTKKSQELGFYSLLFLTQAFGKQNVTDPLRIGVISNNVQEVTGEEELSPEKATVLGPCKVISQEYPNISCHSIDLGSGFLGEKLIDQLIAELTGNHSEYFVAYRGSHRWAQTFEAVRLDGQARDTRLREGGVYLITGGLGRIGLTLAEYLAQSVRAKLVLVGRTAFPERHAWEEWLKSHDDEDQTSRQIRKLQALEELGAEVLLLNADVANHEQMQGVISRTVEQFGNLHGVIHGAATLGEKAFGHIQEASETQCEQQFHSKVRGLLVLEKALRGRELDFCLLMSSLAAVLGGLGYVAYSAANIFMDAFVHQHNKTNRTQWTSVDWDGWRFWEGIEQKAGMGASVAALAITPKEGTEAFQRLLAAGPATQVIVSTGNLQTRIDQWIKLESSEEAEQSEKIDAPSLYPRPALQSAYVGPRNEIEQTVIDIWQKLLGVEQVGVYDNFFELGGHSLLGVQVTSRLRNAFHMELPLRALFEVPTAADLAEVIAQGLAEKAEPKRMASMLAELEELSDEEVQQLLAVEILQSN